MGITVEVRGDQKFQDIRRAIERLADQSLQQELLESIGAVVESQTRRRISSENPVLPARNGRTGLTATRKPDTATRVCYRATATCSTVSSMWSAALSFVWVRHLIMAGRITRVFPARCLCQPISASSHRHLVGRLNTGYGKPWGRINVC